MLLELIPYKFLLINFRVYELSSSIQIIFFSKFHIYFITQHLNHVEFVNCKFKRSKIHSNDFTSLQISITITHESNAQIIEQVIKMRSLEKIKYQLMTSIIFIFLALSG